VNSFHSKNEVSTEAGQLQLQADKPAGANAANWLPAPKAPFYVILRTYGPKPTMLDGSYKIPPISNVK